jgi:hypothetical protein
VDPEPVRPTPATYKDAARESIRLVGATLLDPDSLRPDPEPEAEPDHRGRGCAWLGIFGALAVFWVGVALIVGEWLG